MFSKICSLLFIAAIVVTVGCEPRYEKSQYIKLLEERVSNQEAAIRNQKAAIEQMKRDLDIAISKNERDEACITNLEKRIGELHKNRYRLELDLENLVKSLEAAKIGETNPAEDEEPTRPEVTNIGDGITLEKPHDGRPAKLVIAGRILFPSGEFELSEKGKKALLSIAAILKEKTGNSVLRVDGHTDNVRVRIPNDKGIKDNGHLSVLRAYSVYTFLVKQGKINPKRVFFAGWGEHKPIADNSNEAGRRKNRRVEILILPPDGPIIKPTR